MRQGRAKQNGSAQQRALSSIHSGGNRLEHAAQAVGSPEPLGTMNAVTPVYML